MRKRDGSGAAIGFITAVLAITLGGCAGVSGLEVVQNRMIVPASTFTSVHVECPSGKKVLGGGSASRRRTL